MKYGFKNQFRSRWLLVYTLFYFGVAYALLQFGGDSKRAVASLINIVILFNPSVSILYSTVYWYASSNYNHLLLIQPVSRFQVFLSTWLSISLGLSGAFILGIGLSFFAGGIFSIDILHLALAGMLLNFIFSVLGILCAVIFSDRMRGIAASLGLWLYFSIVHDGILFLMLSALRNYPIEKPAFFMMALNPIDLSRLYLLFRFDLAALMGYTGSLLQKMTESFWGVLVLTLGLSIWIALPAWITAHIFNRRDL
jgi:Cu-processing system permease protein